MIIRDTLQRRIGLLRDLAGSDEQQHLARARLRSIRTRYAWEVRAALPRARTPWVLVGLVEHLGDIVAAEPIARYLRSQYPDATIAWAVRPPFRELIDTHPCIDLAVPVNCLTEWMALRDSSSFDHVHDLHVPGKHCPICRIKLPALRHHRGIRMENYYHHGNLLEIYCTCGSLPVLRDGPLVYLTDTHRQRIDALDLPERFVAVHASSNQESRDWDRRKWEAFARRTAPAISIVEIGATPVLAPSHGIVGMCGHLSILESAEVIRRAELFIGIDSGPAHLANAVGTFGIVLLGHYGPYTRYMPYSGGYADGSNAYVLHHDGPVAEMPVARVVEALQRRLPVLESAYG